MAETTPIQLLIDWCSKNTVIKGQVGANVYQGLSRKAKDLDRVFSREKSLVDFVRLPMGGGTFFHKLGVAFVSMEVWHFDSIADAQGIYQVIWDEIISTQFMKGTTYSIGVYDYIAPQDDMGWENKYWVVRGSLKLNWQKR